MVRDGPVRRAAEDGRKGEPGAENTGQRHQPAGWRAGPRVRLRAHLGCRERVLLLGERDHDRPGVHVVLCNIGVVRYYLTEGRGQFNPVLHLVVPVVASAAGIVVVWKSYFSPFTSTGPVVWGLMTFIVVLVLTVVILVYLRVTGKEDWMRRAPLVFDQSSGSH